MLLVAAFGMLAWAVRRSGSAGFLTRHWPLASWMAMAILGMVWGIGKVYREPPGRQASSILLLVGSLLALILGPLAYQVFFAGFDLSGLGP